MVREQIAVMVTTITMIEEKSPACTADSPMIIAPKNDKDDPKDVGILVPDSRSKSKKNIRCYREGN